LHATGALCNRVSNRMMDACEIELSAFSVHPPLTLAVDWE
jgi:hypothetical protein